MKDTIEQRYKLIQEAVVQNKKFIIIAGWYDDISNITVTVVEAPNKLLAYLSTYGATFDEAKDEFKDSTGEDLTAENLKQLMDTHNDAESFLNIIPIEEVRQSKMVIDDTSEFYYDETSQTF